MKSTDMFLSASSRKNVETPLVLPDKTHYAGTAFSPHVISLWDKTEKIINTALLPHPQVQKEHIQNTENKVSTEKKDPIHPNTTPDKNTDISKDSLSKPIPPSREEQIEKVKQAMKKFESFAERSSSGRGFFRNLRDLI